MMSNPKKINKEPTESQKAGSAKNTSSPQTKTKDSSPSPADIGIGFRRSLWIIFSGILVVFLFFGLGGMFVSTVEIDGAVIAPGIVKVKGERKTVQHLEGGIVRKILVEEGDTVAQGQALIVLESSKVEGLIRQLRIQLAARQITAARLQAERSSSEGIMWPADILDESGMPLDEDVSSLIDAEQKIFSSNQQSLRGKLDQLAKQIEQMENENESYSEQGQSLESIIASLDEELQAKQILTDKRFLEETVVLNLKRQLAEQRGQRAYLRGKVAQNKEKIAELRIRMNSLKNVFIEKASGELILVTGQLLDLREQLRPLVESQSRLTVRAPIGGTIASLKIHSPGGVLAPGGDIADIIPKNNGLIIESFVQTNDIARIFSGQKVEVLLSAFENKKENKANGRVVYISADSQAKNTQYGMSAFFVVHVAMDEKDMQRKGLYISPGMSASLFYITKPRTILNYMLEPFIKNFERRRDPIL